MRFGVLGPLVAEDARGPVDLKGPRHRSVLARLLVARGRVVPTELLVDDLWGGAAPEGATGAVQTFVSALRRALEPDRPPRAPARLLVTAGPGYALRADPDAVDAWRFEQAVNTARELLGSGRPADALAGIDAALADWRGPAYAEFASLTWARGEATRLDELRLLAAERRAEALIALGRDAEAIPDLEAHARAQPGREDAWRLYALALYRAGRQGDALAALRRARRVLAEDAGLDPGPELRRLEADILAQSPSLTEPRPAALRAVAPGAVGSDAVGSGAVGSGAVGSAAARAAFGPAAVRAAFGPAAAGAAFGPAAAGAAVVGPAAAGGGAVGGAAVAGGGGELVGRQVEYAQLRAAADGVLARGALRPALISGEAGAGKTALADALVARLGADGWATASGTNPDDRGLPAGWPWHRILDTLSAVVPDPPYAPSPGGDPAAARFRWHRAVGEYLTAVARHAPLLLVVDDLHWAGAETLGLLAALVTEPVAAPVLLVATYRSTDLPAPLAEVLGRVARAEPTRVYLGGLPLAAIPDLVRATIDRDVDTPTAATIHRRTGGNPFFVRELARLYDAEGADGLAAVPPGVRDVVRYRVAALPEPVPAVLHRAAVLGLDLPILTALNEAPSLRPAAAQPGADRATRNPTALDPGAKHGAPPAADVADVAGVANAGGVAGVAGVAGAGGVGDALLGAVEVAVAAGLLVEQGTGRFAFAHALVRDALSSDVSRSRRAAWHAAAADAVERLRPDDVEALAHHYLHADGPDAAARAARYARAAAERAERRHAPSEAARLWDAALEAFDRAGENDIRARLDLIMGGVRAFAVTGALATARHRRAEAIALAEEIGDPVLTARVIGAFDVPAIWTEHDDPALGRHIAEVAARTLSALPADHVADRSRLLATLALELRGEGGERAAAAARDAERLARDLGDPAVLAFALNASFMQSFGRAGRAPERARLGTELVELSHRHELPTFEILGHLILLQARSALAEFVAADEHARVADALGERYQSPLVAVFTDWYRALRASASGSGADAEARYRAAAARLAGTGMSGLERGILPFALLCHRLQRGEPPALPPDTDFGAYAPWARPVLSGGGAAAIPDSPRDLLYEARTCLHARVAIADGDRPAMERLYAALLPAAGELAGAGSGLLTLGPVARYLDDLATALGHPKLGHPKLGRQRDAGA
ncbi:AfsR/SARP family transcriptional regulator [Cryptosporangium aurantiacum]|uniref:AfsR/SARP family transcriptional regulator n=1 Tax=Cryptosporangium aurantiacum TaxID=134849 RepID=UPI001160EE00|nr:AfsR/SARP family transcriptional regulator [Cryptosporangium aurantiacum]